MNIKNSEALYQDYEGLMDSLADVKAGKHAAEVKRTMRTMVPSYWRDYGGIY